MVSSISRQESQSQIKYVGTALVFSFVLIRIHLFQACVYARFLCEQAGVKFILGDPHGKLSNLIIENDGVNKKVAGIQTCDGVRHFGDLVIVAGSVYPYSIYIYRRLTNVQPAAGLHPSSPKPTRQWKRQQGY
jgi:hypothetical protein